MAKKQVRPLRPYAAEADAVEETISIDPPIAPIPTTGDSMFPSRFELPLSVLIALMDQTHPKADMAGAIWYGLIDLHTLDLSPIGKLVLSGVDQTAIRHKMR